MKKGIAETIKMTAGLRTKKNFCNIKSLQSSNIQGENVALIEK